MRIVVVILIVLTTACSRKNVLNEAQDTAFSDYSLQVDSIRELRVKLLTAPTGWLSVVGLHWLKEGVNTIGSTNDNTILFPRTKTETIGAYKLDENGVFFGKVEGVNVTSNGQEYLGGPVDVTYPQSVINHESLYWYILKRGERYGIRLKDTLATNRLAFKGLSYFDVNDAYKVKATVRAPSQDEKVLIKNVLGLSTDYHVAAHLDFKIDGRSYSLAALDEGGDQYFVIFGDVTNGSSTYGGGRFLYPTKVEFGKQTILDFNLAQNPPCAFTDFATCPLPPPGNVMTCAVMAGEQKFENENSHK